MASMNSRAIARPRPVPCLGPEPGANLLNNNADLQQVEVEGHTDERGNDDHNLQLTRDRSASVMRAS